MKTNKLFILLAALMFFFNVSASNSDTLVLDQIVLKTPLINQNNPALTVSEISYGENVSKQGNKYAFVRGGPWRFRRSAEVSGRALDTPFRTA